MNFIKATATCCGSLFFTFYTKFYKMLVQY